jgi:TP901 family phage tail tape measure protein
MSAGSQVAGTAKVVIGVDLGPLERGLGQLRAKMKSVQSDLNAISSSLTRVALPIVGAFGGAVKMMASFEDEMAKVQAVTQSTEDEFAALSAQARKLGATTSFTATEAAEGMKFLGMAGFETKQIMAGIPAVLNLARAGAIGLGRASDIASDIGTAFKLSADEIVRVSDVLAQTAASANTNIALMGSTMKYLAPSAAAAGQTLEDVAIATGLVANAGIKGSQAGTSLAAVLRYLAKTEIQEKMRALGVETLTAEGNIRPLVPLLRDLGKATADMAGAERLALFTELFQARGAKAAINIANATSDSVEKLTQKIADSKGAAAEMARVMEDTTAGAWRRMSSAASEMAITIGFQLKDTVVDVMKWLTKAANEVAEWSKQNKQLIVTVAKIAAGALALAAALKGVAVFIGVGGMMIGGLIKIIPALIAVTKAVVAVKTGILAVTAVLGGPLIFALLAATAAVLAWHKVWERGQNIKAIEDAQFATDRLTQKTEHLNKALARTRTSGRIKDDMQSIILGMKEAGKTDKEIMDEMVKRREVMVARSKEVWTKENALSADAFASRRHEAEQQVKMIDEIQKKGLDAFFGIEADKTKATEEANRRRLIIRKKTIEKIQGIEQRLKDDLMELQEERATAEEDRTIRKQIQEDPTTALADLEARLAAERSEAESARKQAFEAIEEAKKASSNLTEEEIKALAEKVKKEEEDVDRIAQLKLSAEEAVARKTAEISRQQQKANKKSLKTITRVPSGPVLTGTVNLQEQMSGLFNVTEMETQTGLLRDSVDRLDIIAKNTQYGGYQA